MSNREDNLSKRQISTQAAAEYNSGIRDNFVGHGINGQFNIEQPLPKRNSLKVEKIIDSNNVNALICLGVDRPSSAVTAESRINSSAIDIVVGKGSSYISEIGAGKEPIVVDPHFMDDAARIYISERSNLDLYFNIDNKSSEKARNKQPSSENKSGIGLKADVVRIVARQGITLVSSNTDVKNSKGDSTTSAGVALLGSNQSEKLQPMVLGNGLKNTLDDMNLKINNVISTLNNFMYAQNQINLAFAQHYHISPFGGAPTLPPIEESVIALKQSAKIAQTGIFSIMQKIVNESSNAVNISSEKYDYLSSYHKLD